MSAIVTPGSDDNILVMAGSILIGLLSGELVHRMCQLIDEWPHLRTRHRSSKTKLVQAVFTTKNNQHFSVTILLFISLCFVSTSQDVKGVVKQVLPWMMVWALTRMFGVFDHELDTQEILDETNALLGPGLAANYWFALIKPVVQRGIQRKVTNFLRSRERTDIRSFNKLIILIPDNCQLRVTKGDLEAQNIFSLGEIFFQTERPQGIEQSVYWIYESAKDEETKNKHGQKILFLFDFPQILQSAMGENRGYREEEIPEVRKRNIKAFQDTLENLMDSVDHNKCKKDVTFHHYIHKQETNLASVLREKIFIEEIQDSLETDTSDSESENEED
eukprot:GFUD01032310.1.p1 GENE.GFUD01032310.1~~GFUD01032310.1.p1  ORF type:complete len:346 (+),score=80.50 GFUD01032310.1:44-1039(+)